jgi:hypothetical protein
MTLTPQMVTIDCHDSVALAKFWTAACDYVVTWNSGAGEYVMLAPAGEASGVRIGLQSVPEPRVGKNRIHLDFIATSSMADEVGRLTALGASVVGEHSIPGVATWTVMADPEGNVFCVSGRPSSSDTSSDGASSDGSSSDG